MIVMNRLFYFNFFLNIYELHFFFQKCLINERVRRLSIPECITYVTIRMTKYPLLIEAIIKATKGNSFLNWTLSFNPFVPNASFFYILKTFCIGNKGCIGNKWVNEQINTFSEEYPQRTLLDWYFPMFVKENSKTMSSAGSYLLKVIDKYIK